MENENRIKGCRNFRSLGRIPLAETDGYTKEQIFRSDCLSRLTPADIDRLKDMPIRCVIDLRGAEEIALRPNPFKEETGIDFYNISLVEGIKTTNYLKNQPEHLGKLYTDLLDEAGEEIGHVLRIITKYTHEKVLFHCSAGKDRTGVIAALLLAVAGVDETDIVTDYAKTYPLMKEIFEQDRIEAEKHGYIMGEHLFYSEPAYMEEMLNHLKEKYQNAEQYLLKFMSADEVSLLKQIMVA